MDNEGAATTAKKSKTKGLKGFSKLSTPVKVAYVGGGLLVGYLGYRMYESYAANKAAGATNASPADSTTDGATPADIATGGATPGSETGDPFQVGDPGSSSGETYGQEIDDLEANVGLDQTNWNNADAELAAIIAATGASVNPPGSTGNGLHETRWSAASRAALVADVAKATGLSANEAGQQVSLYLEGKPLTNGGAVNAIGNQIRAGTAPTSNGSTTLPTPVLAKGVTQAKPSTALTNAEAVAAKDKGTPAEAQAEANVTRTKTIVASQKK